MLEREATRLKEEGSSLKVSVDANAFMVSASAAHSQSDDQSQREGVKNKQTRRSKTVIGAPIDPVTGTIPSTLQPGLLSGEVATFCHMLAMVPGVKRDTIRACDKFVQSQRFCYTNLPKTVDPTNDFQTLKEHVFASRSFEHCLEDFGVPIFGWKLAGGAFNGSEKYPHKTLDECMMDCSKNNCSLAMFQNGVCRMCTPTPSERKVVFDDKKYTKETCSEALRKEAFTNVGFLNKDGSCIGDRGVSFDDSNCFKNLIPCSENEHCFGIVRQLPKSHMFHDVVEPIGLKLSIGDFVRGHNLGTSTVKVTLKQPEKCFLTRDIIERFMPGPVQERNAHGRAKARSILQDVMRKTADACKPRCESLDGCDSFEVRWPGIEDDLKSPFSELISFTALNDRTDGNRYPYVSNDPEKELIDTTEVRRGIGEPSAKIEDIEHEPSFVNETFGTHHFTQIDPNVIRIVYNDSEDSIHWGSESTVCKDRNVPLQLTMKCTFFAKHEVTIQNRETNWCHKSEKFCDFISGVFVEKDWFRVNIN